MSANVIRRVSLAKASIVVFVIVALLTTVFMLKMTQGQAATGSSATQLAVPHYFGPWTNWAMSPLTLPDATVTITGDGSGATAAATVGADGAVTGIDVTDPGSGYTNAAVTVTGAGDKATASAVITPSGAVNNVNVDLNGGGSAYTKPSVAFSGGGIGATQATGTAYGAVDSLKISNAGSGYQMPTVDIDMPDDPSGTQAMAHVTKNAQGVITGIFIDDPGSGYASAPHIVIRDGTIFDPINNAGSGATATATLTIQTIGLDTYGAGYTSAPAVTISDDVGAGNGATATATIEVGVVSSIHLVTGGTGYVTPGGIRKFQDTLPGLCDPATGGCPAWSVDPTTNVQTTKYIPLAVPETVMYNGIASDQYELAVVQYRTIFSSDLPATLARGYVQLETPTWLVAHPGVSQHYPLTNANVDPAQPDTPIMIDGKQAYSVTPPQWLGPFIVAAKDKPVRIVYHNLLPTGAAGDLFVPTDSTSMGSGMGPMPMADPVDNGTVYDQVRNPICTLYPKSALCFKDNRAELHLHGGTTPWISDGTPDQWITPAGETTDWPQGVDVQNVPDMKVGDSPTDGIQTYYYTNQQSARLLWIHDHSWGITRLNVYVGEAMGYVVQDDTEKALVSSGTIPGASATLPLVVQDRTFVPDDSQLYDQSANGTITSYGQDPTWDSARWGSKGSFWYHHVYMPAQNPGDPSGQSSVGRWMYGPWFWPPASDVKYGPIDNPYYKPDCKLDDPGSWQYQTSPYCEPQKIPG
ncbi:MAG: hypothetical protein WCN81_10210, partial [Actinomycetes bacterium]